MHKHTVTISFNTDRALTDEELNTLTDSIALQIEEPMADENEQADYATHSITIRTDRN